jgi:hypothetical protein
MPSHTATALVEMDPCRKDKEEERGERKDEEEEEEDKE